MMNANNRLAAQAIMAWTVVLNMNERKRLMVMQGFSQEDERFEDPSEAFVTLYWTMLVLEDNR